MGAHLSTHDTADKALVDRLEGLQVRSTSNDFVHVSKDGSQSEKQALSRLVHREPEGISVKLVEDWQSTFLKDPKNRLALSALSNADPRTVLTSTPATLSDPQIFNVRIPLEGTPITNQRSSGRCWLFASTNVFRVALARRYNLAGFELSQSYLFFWDKLEKANWFLEQAIATAGDHDLDSRLVQHLLGDLISDGGQWDMVYNLVDKYGLVPQSLYPDSWNAQNSGVLNSVLKTKLREYALTLRSLVNEQSATAQSVKDAKSKMLQSILGVLTLTLGAPPHPHEAFVWTYEDKDGKAHELTSTPRAFARDISSSQCRVSSATIAGMVSLVHDPRHDPLTLLTVDRLGNIPACASFAPASPSSSALMWAKFSSSRSGVMDLNLVDYEVGFDVSLLAMSKADRLRTGESQMTHAMVLTAVHIDDKTGRSVRWRVQNSWGEAAGDKGWFVMSDAWMDEFVYQAVIDPRFLDKETKDVLKQEPIVLPLWDPMGSLA
ncbi:cysteine proteinase [Verticillium alfalfae VaMs.102]|uniref:Cysteine proteinase 1, mitochondrial n=1 Tax=Verticillium alfalfae (strain VaMs.102 / ATCC MYA-4576 / FGSC 10136) TaxID=526221 RepID=C9SBG1_VERA1|nr:cysteine proteinase [Verticillium alfalfae VaMs.102]EEY15695.1 cysteine proteinase [Verticillium alfalfae VaMs.102]